jgi:hypothetical protein
VAARRVGKQVTNVGDGDLEESDHEEGIGEEADFVDDGIDDDEVSPEEQLLLDRKELHELGIELDNPEGFAEEEF